MSKSKFGLLLFVILFFCLPALALNEGEFSSKLTKKEFKVYLPGDVVHIVAEAPIDIKYIIAIMPDGERVQLSFERRSRLWHGHWEVPYTFKKGLYNGKLEATDVEGKIYEGETGEFYIGEPSLVALIGKDLTKEVEMKQELVRETQPVVAVEPPARETAIVETLAPKPTVKKVKKPGLTAKQKAQRQAQAQLKKESNKSLKKAKIITAARFYMDNKDYTAAKQQLILLQKTDPQSLEIKTLLYRLDQLIKVRGGKT